MCSRFRVSSSRFFWAWKGPSSSFCCDSFAWLRPFNFSSHMSDQYHFQLFFCCFSRQPYRRDNDDDNDTGLRLSSPFIFSLALSSRVKRFLTLFIGLPWTWWLFIQPSFGWRDFCCVNVYKFTLLPLLSLFADWLRAACCICSSVSEGANEKETRNRHRRNIVALDIYPL